MVKVKVTKKELPFLKGDLELDETVLKELAAKQQRFKTVFKDRLELSTKETLEKYTARIDSLNTTKATIAKEFNAEIRGIEALVKKLNEPVKKTPVSKGPVRKPPVKKTPVKKSPVKKVVARKTSTTQKKK